MNLEDNLYKSSKELIQVVSTTSRGYDKSPLIKKTTIGGVLIKASPINYEQLEKVLTI